LSFSWFISRRLISDTNQKNSFSRPVIRLSVAAIAFSVAVMVISLATGLGLQKEIKDRLTSFSGHVLLRSYESSVGMEHSPITPDAEWVNTIATKPEVISMQATGNRAGIIKSSSFFEGAIFKGIDANYAAPFIEGALEEGRIPNFAGEQPNDSIVMSRYLFNLLAIEEGERIAMYFFRAAPQPPLLRYFYVSGVFSTGLEQIDEQLILGDLRHLIRINGWDSNAVGGYEVFLAPGADMDEMTTNIRLQIPYDVEAISARQQYEQIFQWVDLFDVNILIIFIVMLVVSAINISSALMIMLLERTRMIGLLKALGATNANIRKIFINKSLYLIGMGLLWGNVIGLGFCILQKQFDLITLDQSVYYVSAVPIHLHWSWVIGINSATVLFCLLCLLLPSLYISRILPAKTISFR
jgi:lipoprotein-releasing system permease protein